LAIALQKPLLALLLLFAHGLAKALLFMSVGSVIATTNCQDLTELGGLGSRMPATTTAYLVAAAGLTGLFPLGCFWCFGLMVDTFRAGHPMLAGVVLLTNALTAFNLVRVFRTVFLGKPHPKTRRSPEVNWLMALPMVSLAVLVLLTPLVIERIDPFLAIPSFPTSRLPRSAGCFLVPLSVPPPGDAAGPLGLRLLYRADLQGHDRGLRGGSGPAHQQR
jgi:NAD(P)H-quinone oxidoreductase subunit 5